MSEREREKEERGERYATTIEREKKRKVAGNREKRERIYPEEAGEREAR